MKSFFSILSAFVLSACSQASLAVVNAPTYFDSIKRISAPYGEGAIHNLDIYIPDGEARAVYPVVFFIHGGRWTDGNKEQYKFVGSRLAKEGFITVIPDYRKYPNVKFPEMIEDPAAALAWTVENIGRYGGDPKTIHVSGHSSGAHMGALLSVDVRYLAVHDLKPSVIKSFVGLAGPYDFTPREKDLIDMFGPPEKFDQMRVGSFINDATPPMFFLWGGQDKVVGMINIDNVLKASKKRGVDADIKVKVYDDLDHTGVISPFSWVYDDRDNLVSDVVDYMRAQD